MITCSRRKESGSACGSSRVLTIGRGAGGGRGDGLVQEVRALGDLEAIRCHAAGTGVQLAGDKERQQLMFDGLQRHEAADQVVFVAAEGVAGGVDVVFEHVDRGVCAVGFT